MLRYYPPAAQKKLGSPWVGPQQVVRMATGHTVGIQKDPEAPIIFIHADDLKICPSPDRPAWTPEASKAWSLCASTVAFRPGSHVSDSDSSPYVDVSSWNNLSTSTSTSDITLKLDQPIDLTGHILSPFYAREFHYQDCQFNSVAHLMCYRYAVLHGLKTFATAVRKWARPLTEFPTSRFQTVGWNSQCRSVLREIYSHLCLTDIAVKTALLESGPRPFSLSCIPPWGGLCDVSTTEIGTNLVNDILIETHVQLVADKLTAPRWLLPVRARPARHTTCQCFWRCPVSSCPAWFASELYWKDHLEEVHKFSEGRGYSYYECLRRFGLEWYGRRSFFDQRGTTGQAIWMDLALARKAGQELHNDYVITAGPEFGSLRSFFRAAVRALVRAYIDYPHPGSR